MTNREAHYYGWRQGRRRGLVLLALGCFYVLVRILGDAAFDHLWGLVLLVPMCTAVYYGMRSLGAHRRFRRPMAESRRTQRVL